jgi:hypothetical protein
MASLGSDTKIIGEMLANDGRYPGDPQALQLSSYANDWGGRTFHIAMNQSDVHSLYTSPYCREILVLWTRDRKLTEEGERILKLYRQEYCGGE